MKCFELGLANRRQCLKSDSQSPPNGVGFIHTTMATTIKKRCGPRQTPLPRFPGFISSVTSYLVDSRKSLFATVNHDFCHENNSMIETTLNKLDSVRKATKPSRLLILVAGKQPFHETSIHLHRVHVIRQDAFSMCTQLTHVDLPDTVRVIEEFAFSECCMQSVTWPKTVPVIAISTFDNCTSLQTIDIPDGVIEIKDSAFSSCSSLTEMHMPNSVIRVGDSAFEWCESLETVVFSNQIERIRESTFESCTSLHDVTFPSKLQYIDDGAFCGCSNIEAIYLPATVKYIGYYAFSDCSSLNMIHIQKDTMNQLSKTEPVRIGPCAFCGCFALERMVCPNDIAVHVGSDAFMDCFAFECDYLPAPITYQEMKWKVVTR